jgi:hypothetical protein
MLLTFLKPIGASHLNALPHLALLLALHLTPRCHFV